jgi:oligopeptide/dipeptide ABC transporter ATP-binding protein
MEEQRKNLKTYFYTEDGVVPAVDDISFHINPGETLGVVGESGCGKSITSLSILRLIQSPPGKTLEGSEIFLNGVDLLKLTEKEMRQVRGNKVSMIFQEPMTSLNPVFRIGNQISETLILHQGYNKENAKKKAIEMLKLVGIPRPEKVVDDFPHSLSGGMRQRAMIAMALACNPQLLIADEPTTALDVTIQAQILELMKTLKTEINSSIMLITHNMGVVAETCDRIIVMYAGKIVEEGNVEEIFTEPKHPYTIGLLKSIPTIDVKQDKLESIPGMVPNPLNMPKGCRFWPRCKSAMAICKEQQPGMTVFGLERRVSCFLYENRGEK